MKKAEQLLGMVNESIKLRDFGKADWDAWGGAQQAEGGAEPKIGMQDITVEGLPEAHPDAEDVKMPNIGVLIIDKSGIGIHFMSEDASATMLHKSFEDFVEACSFAEKHIRSTMEYRELLHLGFSYVGF